MSSTKEGCAADRHDWHSRSYVEDWIARDVTRDEERRKRLSEMLAVAPNPRHAAISVLDVGGGYGVVTEEVLRAFPHARVILQDYSPPMVAEAQRRLARHGDQVGYVVSDLRDPAWTESAGGPFDLAVSAIAIHNLRGLDLIAACYRGIARLLKPGTVFLDYDLFELIGGVAAQAQSMEQAGFARVECIWQEPPLAIIAAFTAAGV